MGATDGSSSARAWDLNFQILSQSFNAISLDRLGQGYTDNPVSDSDYTMHASVQHVIAFLDRLRKKTYHLVSCSRGGGYIVTRIAMKRPDLVKTSTCVSSGTLSPGATRSETATRSRPQPEHDRESIRWYLERYRCNPMIVTESWIEDSFAIACLDKTKNAAYRMWGGGLLKAQFAPQLYRQRAETHRWLIEQGMPCPTLTVWGRNDPGANLDAGLRLVEMFMQRHKQTEWRLFNRSGHFVFREHPEAFNRL